MKREKKHLFKTIKSASLAIFSLAIFSLLSVMPSFALNPPANPQANQTESKQIKELKFY